MEENENAFKHLFNLACLQRISEALISVYPQFDLKSFLRLMPKLKLLEMKPRVRLIRDELKKRLPENYPQALKILLKSNQTKKLQDFDLWPYTEFIQTYGLNNPELSLRALKELTSDFTSEWAIRPFLIQDAKQTLAFLKLCARDKNEHVRRWASEGTRPRLPWGARLYDFIKDPNQALPILEILKFDPELYVRKSIANHLNDISKDHPSLVIEILKRWKTEARKEHADKIGWITRRALRTLIKNGDAQALKLIGVSHKAEVKLDHFKIQKNKIKLGEHLAFEFRLTSFSKKSQKLVVDFIIHHVKANQTTKAKVFKLKTFEILPLQTEYLVKSQRFQKITTASNGTKVVTFRWNRAASLPFSSV
jgi:3-methyladenine DNA glycosylase AlkC